MVSQRGAVPLSVKLVVDDVPLIGESVYLGKTTLAAPSEPETP